MKIKLSESKLKQIVAESVKKVLSEIGDTPKGQFALGAVRGRASARPRYQNNKYGGLNTKSQQDSIANNAADASWEKRKDLDINKYREMNNAEQRGYYYGFNKGMSESVKKGLSEGKINEDDFEPNGELYGLQPLNGGELFDRISSYLERLGDVRVSNFYSDDQNIVVAAHKSARGKRGEIDEIMFNCGYKLYDVGANDEYIYYTYKKGIM